MAKFLGPNSFFTVVFDDKLLCTFTLTEEHIFERTLARFEAAARSRSRDPDLLMTFGFITKGLDMSYALAVLRSSDLAWGNLFNVGGICGEKVELIGTSMFYRSNMRDVLKRFKSLGQDERRVAFVDMMRFAFHDAIRKHNTGLQTNLH